MAIAIRVTNGNARVAASTARIADRRPINRMNSMLKERGESSASLCVEPLLDESQGKENFSHRPLKNVIPAAPTVEDQTFDEQRIKEHENRCGNDPAAQPVGQI